MAHTLIVEDDRDTARMMARLVTRHGCSAATAPSLHDARRQLSLQQPDLLLLDVHLPDGNGLALLDDADLIGDSEVVLMTGQASLESSIGALRKGALDYLLKPVTPAQLQAVLARVMKQPVPPARAPEHAGRFGHLVGDSAPMRAVYEQIERVAGTSITVFVTGESGTGKELVARTLHDMSRRADKPFLAVNCGAISPHLIESEVFGHEKGSFTGADRRHEGFFEQAHGGTLFLDEITEMPPALQVKLLRVLESGSFMRVGATTAQSADVRVIAASNRDLRQSVAAGLLREDLMYRLNVFPIELPPLRERLPDLPLLAHELLRQIGEREGKPKRIEARALAQLAAHPWPGNVRELRNALQRAWVMTAGEVVEQAWLPRASSGTQASGATGLSVPLGAPLCDVERHVILATLDHCGGDRQRTAAVLGLSGRVLAARMKSYGR